MGDKRALWIKINEFRLLGFRQHNITPPTVHNLCLPDTRTINIFNDTLHTSFVKYYIYQKIHFIHVQDRYPLQICLSQAFKKMDGLITRLMHATDKKYIRKITGQVKWSPKYKEAMDLVELWVLLKT